MGNKDVTGLVLVTTLIFFLALVFIVAYIISYNNRKRKHEEEKLQMKQAFDLEIARTALEVTEQTMQTIGTELHDNIGQLLSLTSFTLKSISPSDVEKTTQRIGSAIDLTQKSIKEMRLLGKLLQGEQLLSNGLQEAVDQEVQWLRKSGQYHISCTIEGVFLPEINQQKDLIIFRILQEVLNNIIKHADANLIELSLINKDQQLILAVRDNGIGFNFNNEILSSNRGMGLNNINKRAVLIEGRAEIDSKPGKGTLITIYVPYS